MEDFIASTAFRVFAAVSAALVLKSLALAYLTGSVRAVKKRFPNPEDAKFFKGDSAEDHELAARVGRAHKNGLENEPLFILLGLLWVLAGADAGAMQIYAYTFFVARVLYSLCYVFQLQPWRSLMYMVSSFCLIGMSVQVLMAAFAH